MLTAGMVALRVSLVTGSLRIWSSAQAADLLTSLDRIDGGRSLGCDYELVSEMYLFTCEVSYATHQVRLNGPLANKTVRIAWAMLRHGTDYEPEFTQA